MSTMRKYIKRTTFEQLDFESFIAGETNTILGMENIQEMKGRLKFTCYIAHWYSKCQDWNLVKGLYEAAVDSIELGEETWNSDFTHYETIGSS